MQAGRQTDTQIMAIEAIKAKRAIKAIKAIKAIRAIRAIEAMWLLVVALTQPLSCLCP